MSLLDGILLAALILALAAYWLEHRKVLGAYNDSMKTLNWTITQLQKRRYSADKEYEQTGWAPGSDKPPTEH